MNELANTAVRHAQPGTIHHLSDGLETLCYHACEIFAIIVMPGSRHSTRKHIIKAVQDMAQRRVASYSDSAHTAMSGSDHIARLGTRTIVGTFQQLHAFVLGCFAFSMATPCSPTASPSSLNSSQSSASAPPDSDTNSSVYTSASCSSRDEMEVAKSTTERMFYMTRAIGQVL